MKPQVKKSLSIDAETHKKIAFASVETGRDMWELIRDAWAMYSGSPGVDAEPATVNQGGWSAAECALADRLVAMIRNGDEMAPAVRRLILSSRSSPDDTPQAPQKKTTDEDTPDRSKPAPARRAG